MKKISVALATYKGAIYIRALLDSLAQQHLLPYEVVVSDDNSPDNTLEIVSDFSKTAPFRVRIFSNSVQLGILENFAKAFESCEGDLIAYCDQDDVWSPEKLAILAKSFENPEVKLAMHRSEVVDGELEPLGYQIPAAQEIEAGEVTFPSSIDMTSGLGHQMLFDAQMYRDYAWVFRENFTPLQSISSNYDIQIRFIAGLNGSIVSHEQTLVKFRRHQGATSGAGLIDSKTATVSGFLGKSSSIYNEQADMIHDTAMVLKEHVLPKMPKYEEKLRVYIDFLRQRSEMIRARGLIYKDMPFWQRQMAFWSLIRRGAYVQKRQRGLGHRALLSDAFVSIFGLRGAQAIVAIRRHR
jgi:glycosyltransferase involved in cell wall biosynthesis